MKCKICGEETRKGRQTCIGCDCIKKVAKAGNEAPDRVKEKAISHLESKPELSGFSWSKLFKKNRRVTI